MAVYWHIPFQCYLYVLAVSMFCAYYVITRELPPEALRWLIGSTKAGRNMATARITKRAVDAAKVRKTDSYLWDQELSGFGLKVTPAGRKSISFNIGLGDARAVRAGLPSGS